MNPVHDQPDDLVTITTCETPFQAEILVAVLKDAGIDAVSFGAVQGMFPLGQRLTPVLVQVRTSDAERARAALKQHVSDSVDLDWDQVDVGERVDQVPLTTRKGMPLIPRLGYIMAVLMVLLFLIGFVARVLGLI